MKNYSIPRQARDGEQTCLERSRKSRTILISSIRNYLKIVTLPLSEPQASRMGKGLAGPNKRFLTALGMTLCILIVLLAGSDANARYNGGTGTPEDPYRIATPEDLNDIGNYEEDWDKNFILVNDVNLAGYTGTQFKLIGQFTGVFDGDGHKIWNFTWRATDRDNIGLFSYVGRGGRIKNLGMENANITTPDGCYVGGLAGTNEGMISNCYLAGSIRGGDRVGGLVGGNVGMITNCYSTGNVTGTQRVGGLVGCQVFSIVNPPGSITNCYSTASVEGNDYVGGLVGDNLGTITDCYSTGNVKGTDYSVDGLVGSSNKVVTDCYSTGSVTGERWVGGLVGYQSHSSVVTASFWDTQTSGQLNSASGTPKTTLEMRTKSTFTSAGWDFVEVWGIGENQTYPFLRTEPAGDSNHDKKVNLEDLAILASHWLENAER